MLLSQLSLPFASRGSLSPAVSRVILRLHSPAFTPSCRSAAAAAVAVVGELRGNEEQGRSNRLSTKTTRKERNSHYVSLSSFVVYCYFLYHRFLSFLLSLSCALFSRSENFTIQISFCSKLFGFSSLSLSFSLPRSIYLSVFVLLFLSSFFLQLRAKSFFLIHSHSLFSFSAPSSSGFPRAVQLDSNSSLRKRFIDRDHHSRRFSFGLFFAFSNFPRVSNIGGYFLADANPA